MSKSYLLTADFIVEADDIEDAEEIFETWLEPAISLSESPVTFSEIICAAPANFVEDELTEAGLREEEEVAA